MNAKKIKQAFLSKAPVIAVDKRNSIKNGIVKSVIHTLTDENKVRCDALVEDSCDKNYQVTVHCRNVHFAGKDIKTDVGSEPSTNEHAVNIKNAFKNQEEVIIKMPGFQGEFKRIIAIVYKRSKNGTVICCCSCLDKNREDSTTTARIGYVFTKNEIEKER